MQDKKRAQNNRTLTLSKDEIEPLRNRLITEKNISQNTDIINKTLNGDILKMLNFVPDEFADLIIIDPPYNLSKNFNGMKFNSRSQESYDDFIEAWFPLVCKKLKANGSLYMCGDWKCTSSLQRPEAYQRHARAQGRRRVYKGRERNDLRTFPAQPGIPLGRGRIRHPAAGPRSQEKA